MEEPKDTTKEENESSFGCDVWMPICFLVKEQAKSTVAVKELRKRLDLVERNQFDLIDGVLEIRNFLSNSGNYSSCIATPAANTATTSANDGTPSCNTIAYSEVPQCSRIPSIPLSSDNKKDSVENDKQDSGLYSEQNDVHFFSIRNALKAEETDELLQLLNEIGHRSEILQKQLSVVEDDVNLETARSCSNSSKEAVSPSQQHTASQNTQHCNVDLFENKRINCKHLSSSKRSLYNCIDSTAVSSILKETSVVDLQRLALIYLSDNAVLRTKVKEAEQMISLKQTESEKLENSLKEEVRILMMENRELRIVRDEQKIEMNSLQFRLATLERVLRSFASETQELNVQMDDLQKSPKRGLTNNSYAFENHSNTMARNPRRSSLPTKLSNDVVNVSCVKSKLLPNTSSFLDITVEEEEAEQTALNARKVFSSTPMVLPLQKSHHKLEPSPFSFQAMKKCFNKGNLNEPCLKPNSQSEDTCAKRLNFQRSPKSRDAAECLASNQTTLASRTQSCIAGNCNFADGNQQKRKTRDIQQRIQNILDRIVSESEEAS